MKFGKYEVIKEIGKGAMGVVFLAFDPVIERQVAIKTMNPQLFQDKEQRERFFREAKSAGILQHPNIVTIYDMGMEGDTPYIVMEYVEGKDLDSLIKSNSIDLETSIQIMIQLCDALHYAHLKGIIHRDIKPSNIRVLPDGKIKIMDFGIAKKSGSDLTQTGVLLGTVSYMAPEQLKEGKVSPQSDQFSAGIVFYEMLSGRKCFEGDTITSVMYKIVSFNENQIDLKSVPQNIVYILKKMVSHSPDKRFKSCAEVSALLKDLSKVPVINNDPVEETVVAPPTIPPVVDNEKTRRKIIKSETQKKSHVGIILFFVIFLFLLVSGVFLSYQSHKKRLMQARKIEQENVLQTNKNLGEEKPEKESVEKIPSKTEDIVENSKIEDSVSEDNAALSEDKLLPKQKNPLIKRRVSRERSAKSKPLRIPPKFKKKVKEKDVFSYPNNVKKKERHLNFTEAQKSSLKNFERQAKSMPDLERIARSNQLFNIGMRALGNGANRYAAVSFYKSIILNPKRKEAYAFLCVALARMKAFDDIKKVIKKAQENGITLYDLRQNKMFDRTYTKLSRNGILD